MDVLSYLPTIVRALSSAAGRRLIKQSAFALFRVRFYSRAYAEFALKNRISRRVQLGISLDLLSFSALSLSIIAFIIDYFGFVDRSTITFKFINIVALCTFIVFLVDIFMLKNSRADIEATAKALARAASSGLDSLGASTEDSNVSSEIDWADPAFREWMLTQVATTPEEAAAFAHEERKKVDRLWQNWSFQGRKPELEGLPVSSDDRKARS